MAPQARLTQIWVYPIKSLDGSRRAECLLVPGGGLDGDRRWAMVDDDDRLVNGKRTSAVHRVRASFSWNPLQVTLACRESAGASPIGSRRFALPQQRQPCELWLSEAMGIPVRLQSSQPVGWPDDMAAPGPTLVSWATLKRVAQWFPPATPEEMRARFRPNLVIDGVPPFWEDGLLGETDEPGTFRIGSVVFQAVNPCRRCVVPTRDPETARADSGFMRRFMQLREAELPSWAPRSRFDHFYRLTLNTRWMGAEEAAIREGMLLRPSRRP